jgi:hypothetical protein
MQVLKNNLDSLTYDMVRSSLGLEPLESAVEKGKALTQTVREKFENE